MKQLSSLFLVMAAILFMNTGEVWGDKCVKDSYSCGPTKNQCSDHARIETGTWPFLKTKKCQNNGSAQANGKLTTCMYLCDDNKGYHCPCN